MDNPIKEWTMPDVSVDVANWEEEFAGILNTAYRGSLSPFLYASFALDWYRIRHQSPVH